MERNDGVSRPARSGSVSKTNSGSLCGSVAMNPASIVKLCSTGWQLAQVRPFPPKVSWKNRFAPAQTSVLASPVTTRGSFAQAASRWFGVTALVAAATATGGCDESETPHETAAAANTAAAIRIPITGPAVELRTNTDALSSLMTDLSFVGVFHRSHLQNCSVGSTSSLDHHQGR
ncbi:MAG TPA: hypothetical protein VHT91_04125 [Kofleriaceae bacterium]|nr:hypothetical protein [Kofleriaceae bacterium]